MRIAKISMVAICLIAVAESGFAADELKLPELKVSKPTKAPPKIDGKLDDEAWKEAGVSESFKLANGETPKSKTKLYVMQDDQNLYIAVECFEDAEALKNLKTSATTHDLDAIWADDDVELFIDPSNKRITNYQIIINSKGVNWDCFYAGPNQEPDKSWEPKYNVAANVGQDSWTVEVAIPFATFDRSDKSEAEWAFNVARSRATAAEFIYWSPVFAATSHVPEKFGKLTDMPIRVLKPEASKEPAK
ncbi:MAG: sugar-binding protein [Planctomycetota bacterium]